MPTVSVAVPRKGRPLQAVLERVAQYTNTTAVVDDVISTLQYEKAITKGRHDPDQDIYDRLAAYSNVSTAEQPEYSLLRDDRDGMPRRIVFDSLTVSHDGMDLRLVGREEPFRALRKHEFALGFDSADLVLEEVVQLRGDPLTDIASLNDRIDPMDTDVSVRTGMGDTVYHTLLATPETLGLYDESLSRSFVETYEGELCLSPRYERLVEAVLGMDAIENVSFCHPADGQTEEAAIAETGLGVYLTVSGSTAREHGLVVGEKLFPSETVLLENSAELDEQARRATALIEGPDIETKLAVQ